MPCRSGSHSRFGEWKSRSTQVRSVSIAGLQRLAPHRHIDRAGGVGNLGAERRQIPVEQQLGLHQHAHRGRSAAACAGRAARPAACRAGAGRAARPARRPPRRSAPRSAPAARPATTNSLPRSSMISKPFVDVGLEDLRRREAELAQPVGHGDERFDVLGEMHDGAVRLAVAHRRAVRPARRVHQDGALVAEPQPLVGAGRGVALDARCARPRRSRWLPESGGSRRAARRAARTRRSR